MSEGSDPNAVTYVSYILAWYTCTIKWWWQFTACTWIMYKKIETMTCKAFSIDKCIPHSSLSKWKPYDYCIAGIICQAYFCSFHSRLMKWIFGEWKGHFSIPCKLNGCSEQNYNLFKASKTTIRLDSINLYLCSNIIYISKDNVNYKL